MRSTAQGAELAALKAAVCSPLGEDRLGRSTKNFLQLHPQKWSTTETEQGTLNRKIQLWSVTQPPAPSPGPPEGLVLTMVLTRKPGAEQTAATWPQRNPNIQLHNGHFCTLIYLECCSGSFGLVL